MKFDTKVIHAAIKPDTDTGSIVTPIHQTATYVMEKVGQDKGYDYTRSANPTREIMEDHLAALDNGKYGIAFSSGMAAIDSCLKLLKSGDHVICSDDVYGGTYRLFDQLLVNYGIRFSFIDTSFPDQVEKAITSDTRMIWAETPTNPLLKITDLNAISLIAKKNNLIFAVDSTFSTPVFLRPLEFDVDLVMHSTTKYITGHSQLIGGIVITNRKDLANKLRFAQKTIGAVPSPIDCWLTLLGVKTLDVRMKKHEENAIKIAEFLDSHPKVSTLTYPGLPSHPMYDVAKEQMSGFSGMISLELKGGIPAGEKFLNSVKLALLAESLGSVETMVLHPASMTHGDVPKEYRLTHGLSDGLVRISVGIENVDDIINDFKQALDKV
ncbi:MAG: trans-sulfuration enzyme family protein [Candidatus Neomarinimicrobiota bacterium]|nr:MAG: PLP-dependent transferase [bacterium]|tara:strand:+ start:728 stop:1870 length:1143 start_codon:yes stop_codon:yes gene_type:complete